jgi:beta-glucan synthesis-associated protein KRE6
MGMLGLMELVYIALFLSFRLIGSQIVAFVGQSPVLIQIPDLIDTQTPKEAHTRTGFDGIEYNLVFSDEFNTPGRSFYPGA